MPLTIDVALERLANECHDERERVKEAMAKGSAKDYGMYRELAGQAMALDRIRSYIIDLNKEIESY